MITNLDPKPWLVDEVPARYTDDEIKESARSDNPILWQLARHDPRPEFDVGDNPILRGVVHDAEHSDDFAHDLRSHAEFWLSTPEDWEGTPEQIGHARTVLEAIVREK